MHHTAMMSLLLRSVGIWLLILACAIVNGGLRESALIPLLGTSAAFVASGLLLSACIVGVSLWLVPRLGPLQAMQAVGLGLFWLCLTLAFEFGFGRLVLHHSWHEIFEAYTFKNGNLWPLVLLVTFIAPVLAVRLSD